MADRMITIEAPGFDKDKDELVVVSFSGQESISRPFSFQLDLVSKNLDIQPDKFIGLQVDVSIGRTSGPPRFFNGFISRFSSLFTAPGKTAGEMYRTYRAEIVPWLWFLTQTSDCRVFNKPAEDKLKVIDIIETVLKENKHHKISRGDLKEGKEYEMEYCVQYRETDFNFVSRLMEQFGIYYYFKHEKGSHELVLSDSIAGYADCVEKKVSFSGSIGAVKVDHLTMWEHEYAFSPGKYTHTDYDFKNPSTDLRRSSGDSAAKLSGHKDYELFDYPGEYVTAADGKTLADQRVQEGETPHNTVRGSSVCRTFTPGHQFTLENHNSSGENGDYVFTTVLHSAVQPGPLSTDSGGAFFYTNTFSCIPAKTLYRPATITPKPYVSGVQTALVVGPDGQEIHCDKFGRVRVRFHWERQGEKRDEQMTPDEKCTCWIRVAHQVAGKKWGFLALPRIGQEVVVDFLEGDPDRPLIVGSVYNAEQMPHYDLPEHQAKTYIKTNSTKGGKGFNELMFDDLAGKERLFMHAQRDKDVHVLNDHREQIHSDKHRIIGDDSRDDPQGNLIELLHGNKQLTIKKHQLEHIHGSYALLIGNGDSEDPGVLDIFVEKKERKKIGREGKHLIVEGDSSSQIGGKLSFQVTGEHHETAGGYALDCGQGNVHVKGMNVVVEGTAQLTIKVGGSFVAISPAGVDIFGPMVNINSGGSAGSGSGASPSSPEEAPEAAPAEPDKPWNSTTGFKSAKDKG